MTDSKDIKQPIQTLEQYANAKSKKRQEEEEAKRKEDLRLLVLKLRLDDAYTEDYKTAIQNIALTEEELTYITNYITECDNAKALNIQIYQMKTAGQEYKYDYFKHLLNCYVKV